MKSTAVSHTLLAAWLQENYPQVFAELAQYANAPPPDRQSLSGFTDILSSIGSGISSAASSVASGLSSTVKAVGGFIASDAGQQTLATIVNAKLQSNVNKQLVAAQIARANADQAPAPVQNAINPATGTYMPTLTLANGQTVPVTSSVLAGLQPTFMQRYGIWLLGGLLVAGVVGVAMFGRR